MKRLFLFLILALGVQLTVSALSWKEDVDGDGREEVIFLDKDDDGNPEGAEVDRDGDGTFEEYWVDKDDDGDWEQKWLDTDADGFWDQGLQDTDDDDKFDQKWTDLNKNHKIDAVELEVLAPQQQIVVDGPAPKLAPAERVDCKCTGIRNTKKDTKKDPRDTSSDAARHDKSRLPSWVAVLIGILVLVAMVVILGRGKEVAK